MSSFADIVLEQLGGRSTLDIMLGIKSLGVLESTKTLTVKFKAKGREGINTIVIRLKPSDTYSLEFWKCRGLQTKLIEVRSDIYADRLVSTCEEITGLAFRTPKVVFPR